LTTSREAALALVKPEQLLIARQVFGEDRIEVLKEQIARGATDAELELFAMVCQRTKLDPFARQIWFYRRRANDPPIIQASIDGLRLIAERTGQYQGQRGPEWCGSDGKWREVWLQADPPAAARVGVVRRGFSLPLWSVAVWERAKQTYWHAESKSQRLMPLWERYGPEMLAKTAEAHGLKRAFPQETSGLEVADVPNLEDEQSMQVRQAHNARRYDEIFGKEDVLTNDAGQRVQRATGEVLDEPPTQGAPDPHLDEALRRNADLQERAFDLGVKGLQALKAQPAWSLPKALEANQELEDRIRSRNNDLDLQAAHESRQPLL
jgi:phage recombination protein Bet